MVYNRVHIFFIGKNFNKVETFIVCTGNSQKNTNNTIHHCIKKSVMFRLFFKTFILLGTITI